MKIILLKYPTILTGCEAELFTKGQENDQLKAEIAQLKARGQKQDQEIVSLKLQSKQQKPLNEGNCKLLQKQNNIIQAKNLQAFPKKIQDECTNYMTLDSPRRATSYTVNRKTAKYDYYSYIFLRKNERRKEMAPQWGGPGRYRFTGPFTRMAVRGEVSGNWRCGAECPVYIKDPKAHNLKVGEMKDNVHVCYRYTNKTWCHWKITITRCPGNYFVYWLRNLGPHMGYCGAK